MRIGLLFTLLLATFMLGATCIPLIQESGPTPTPPTALGVTVLTPTRDATLGQGAVLPIQWTALNNTGGKGTGTLLVESRVDLKRTVLADNVAINGNRSITTQWDTTGFAGGLYVVYADLDTAEQHEETSGPGRITIDVPPTLRFTAPTQNTTFSTTQGLTIGWTGSDEEGTGTVSIGLDPDTNHASGNEVFIHDATLGATAADASFSWTGTDLNGGTVAPGTYNLFASVGDPANADHFVNAGVQIIVPDPNNLPPPPPTVTLGITEPASDTTFLRSTASLTITFGINQFQDVLIDLKIDTDDNHTNGNEATILSQRLITGGTQTDTFVWDGKYAAGTSTPPGTPVDLTVPDGIYRLFIVMNTGTGTPQTADGPGLVFRRTTDKQPLIGMLQPSGQQTVTAGAFVTINWRTDDPDHVATVHLTVDNDPRPAHEEPGDTFPELTILSGRPTAATGSLQNSFVWQIPGSFQPGTYYIFGYVAVDGTDHESSVAPGQLVIKNPTGP